MLVAGVMSGTSADGVDVAICRVSPPTTPASIPRVKVLAHEAFPYCDELRAAVLEAMDAKRTSAAEMARLSWRLGAVYAECVRLTAERHKLQPALVACHGQTIYHQAEALAYTGAPVRCTWQIGEASVMAERLQIPVVSDFRPADMAAGGQGAPLVPMLDFCLFRQSTKNRLLLNLGGIANVTALPAACSTSEVLAFDTGPANMVIDAVMQTLYGRAFDCGGATAKRGRVLEEVLSELMTMSYFTAPPPKTCGREEFGSDFARRLLAICTKQGARKQDVIATATAFTAATAVQACIAFCAPHFALHAPRARRTEMLVSGGGERNATLMALLRDGLAGEGISVASTSEAGLAAEAKEAAAFALLGWLRWHGLPGNLPAATGAERLAVLGKVTMV